MGARYGARLKPAAVAEHRGALHNARLVAALVLGGTYTDLQEATGLSYHTAMRYCKAFKAVGHAYIDHYELDEKSVASRPFWKFCLNPTKDAKRPKKTKKQLALYQREWRADRRVRETPSIFHYRPPRYAEGTRGQT